MGCLSAPQIEGEGEVRVHRRGRDAARSRGEAELLEAGLAPRLGRVLFMGVLMLGGVVNGMSPNRSGTSMGIIAAAAIVLGLLGLTIGRLVRDRRCSEPKCGGPLTPTTKVCPRCGGDVVGTIANAKDRLAAEEAHFKARNRLPELDDPEPAALRSGEQGPPRPADAPPA